MIRLFENRVGQDQCPNLDHLSAE